VRGSLSDLRKYCTFNNQDLCFSSFQTNIWAITIMKPSIVRASGKVRGYDPALLGKNRTTSHYFSKIANCIISHYSAKRNRSKSHYFALFGQKSCFFALLGRNRAFSHIFPIFSRTFPDALNSVIQHVQVSQMEFSSARSPCLYILYLDLSLLFVSLKIVHQVPLLHDQEFLPCFLSLHL